MPSIACGPGICMEVSHMHRTFSRKRHASAQGSLPLQAFVRPTPFRMVIVLLLVASCLLVGIAALLLGPFLILSGGFLFLLTVALLCVIGIAKGCVSFA